MAEIIVIVDECLGLLIRKMCDPSSLGINFAYHITLVASLVELKSKRPAVISPSGKIQRELVGIHRRLKGDLSTGIDIKQNRKRSRKHITRLGIISPLEDRLLLSRRSGLNQRDAPCLHMIRLQGNELTRIRRPSQRPSVIGQFVIAIHRKRILHLRSFIIYW